MLSLVVGGRISTKREFSLMSYLIPRERVYIGKAREVSASFALFTSSPNLGLISVMSF